MSVSRAEAKMLSGDSRYMLQLKQAASKITDERLKARIMKLLQRFKAQSGLASLSYRMKILNQLYLEANSISNEITKKFFKKVVRRYEAALERQLDNTVSHTEYFIRIIQRFFAYVGETTEDMKYGGEDFYSIFQNVNQFQTQYRTALWRDLKKFVWKAKISLRKMDLEDVVERLDVLINNLEFWASDDLTSVLSEYTYTYDTSDASFTESQIGALKQVLRQAQAVRSDLKKFIDEQKASKKEAEDNLRLPKHIRGRIKDFIGLKLRL